MDYLYLNIHPRIKYQDEIKLKVIDNNTVYKGPGYHIVPHNF